MQSMIPIRPGIRVRFDFLDEVHEGLVIDRVENADDEVWDVVMIRYENGQQVSGLLRLHASELRPFN